jgi:tetratricopeptide (TPR) repeat protein
VSEVTVERIGLQARKNYWTGNHLYRQFIEQCQDDSVERRNWRRHTSRSELGVKSGRRNVPSRRSKDWVYERLARENPTVATYQNGLGGAYHELGRVQRFAGRLAEAAVSHQRGLEIYENLATRNPLNRQVRDGLARALIDLGTTQNAMGRPAEAEASLERARNHETLAGGPGYRICRVFPARHTNSAIYSMMGRLARPRRRPSAAKLFAGSEPGADY